MALQPNKDLRLLNEQPIFLFYSFVGLDVHSATSVLRYSS